MRSVSVLTREIKSPVRLAPKNSSDKLLQMGVGRVAHVGGDPLAHPGQHVGPRPAQQPRQDRRPGHREEIPADQAEIVRSPLSS